MRVLLVNHFYQQAKALLEQLSFDLKDTSIVVVNDGEQAINHMTRTHFDIVILPLVLPDLDILTLVDMTQSKLAGGTAFIAVTENVSDSLINKCLTRGIDEIVSAEQLNKTLLYKVYARTVSRLGLYQALNMQSQDIKHVTRTDKLTGLKNRDFFLTSLKALLQRAHREQVKASLILIDVDNFKSCNDYYGHYVGDLYLQKAAKELLKVCRDDDLVCYFGGDEFAILANDLDTGTALFNFANRLQKVFSSPIECLGHKLELGASIGVAMFPDSAADDKELLKAAEIAMYKAKQAGKNKFYFYSKLLHEQLEEQLEVENSLLDGIKNNEFRLFYQPQLAVNPTRVVGAEALIRWYHPTLGLLSPDRFIPFAETSGKIIQLGQWVIQQACSQLVLWRRNNVVSEEFRVSINISAVQLADETFTDRFFDCLRQFSLPPNVIELEIVESVLIHDMELVRNTIAELVDAGVGFAVDDFGTGYSSLAYLRDLPVTTLKVDRSFVIGLPSDVKGCNLLKALISMASSLEMNVVVEGVETLEQASLCEKYKAQVLQGYYFSKPIGDLTDFESFCRSLQKSEL
ncbi:response regulator [Catenovulum agarivorans DS-2]|uniref:Response regulator n=1 Tax=Catenovulum agarivorans DS-2 TaxID=1328313 RepID=W7QGL2_9ALTE|nr:EAL domain-containing protein [Catenovulum agarivorans]EWH11051.1 response regulator [Catenovulum agarivorans DS-2]